MIEQNDTRLIFSKTSSKMLLKNHKNIQLLIAVVKNDKPTSKSRFPSSY